MKFTVEVPDATYDWMASRNGGTVTPERQLEVAIAMNLRAIMMQDPPQALMPAMLQINALCQPVVTSEPTDPEEPNEN